ncbi:MAG TPA: phenylalanine--tRNA ligase subunit alpha [Candidatus Saccharimonadales bacterium]|jgi:phenylalanyl-tRNA synthetase alpha chain
MTYQDTRISDTAELLTKRFQELTVKEDILKAPELKALYAEIPLLPAQQRGPYGRELNQLKQELVGLVDGHKEQAEALPPIDVTAPFDTNVPMDRRPFLLGGEVGSRHPLMVERDRILDIFYRMGFTASESRELDDDYHMFGALNFPEGHPARDDYDTFMTEQTDKDGKRFVAPAHTSTMQNRILRQYAAGLEKGEPIAVVIPDRVYRNEDLDARHEHTFYQVEGIYVGRGVHAGNLIATLKTWLHSYYGREIDIKTQPFYFPFTEPSFEFAASCIFCDGKGCSICSQSGWIELGGCGMIHPNVLREAGIDSDTYTGFAWGFGIERIVMLKHNIEDVRHFESGKLEFLRQFS